jgi:hypothetical protein
VSDDDNYPNAETAADNAHVGYALAFSLLEELEKRDPGTWQRVWCRAQRLINEYGLNNPRIEDWLTKISECPPPD